MADANDCFEIPAGKCSATGIFQVGQVLRLPMNHESSLLRDGPFKGIDYLSEQITKGGSLELSYPPADPFRVRTDRQFKTQSAHLEGQSEQVRWRTMVTETIFSNQKLLTALLNEEEVRTYLARTGHRGNLYLVTKVVKVQEFIPQVPQGFATSSNQPEPSRIGLPHREDEPFILYYALERIIYSRTRDDICSEPYHPSQHMLNSIAGLNSSFGWLFFLLYGWLFALRHQRKSGEFHKNGNSTRRDHSPCLVWTAAPTTSDMGVLLEDPIPRDAIYRTRWPVSRRATVTILDEYASDGSDDFEDVIEPQESVSQASSADYFEGPASRLSRAIEHVPPSYDKYSPEGWPAYDTASFPEYPRRLTYAPRSEIGCMTDPDLPTYRSDAGISNNRSVQSEKIPSAMTEAVFDSDTKLTVNTAGDAVVETDKWFSEYMQKTQRFFKTLRKPRKSPLVKIAILDTGLDMGHPLLRQYRDNNQIAPEFSRDFVRIGGIGEQLYVEDDSTGHGTHCTHLLLKTCPSARVYAAKVFDGPFGDDCTANRIRDAINFAVDKWEVDIISMSFAFSKSQNTIRDCIASAKGRRSVFFFAAASNNRHNERSPVGFPASLDNVIRVNSSTYEDDRSKFSPPGSPDERKFSVIGEHLNAAFPAEKNHMNFEKRLSGTSMSTPILAGIAGLVIEYSRLRNASLINNKDELLNDEGMKKVFRHCMTPRDALNTTGYLNIKPWLLFDAEERDEPRVASRISDALS